MKDGSSEFAIRDAVPDHRRPSLARLVQKAQEARFSRLNRRDPVPSTSNAARQPSAASFYVPRLPGQPPELQLAPIYSGHLPASYLMPGDADSQENDAHLFFLLVKAKHVADRAKLVIWFNGGVHVCGDR